MKKEKGREYISEKILPGLKHDEMGAPILDSSFISISDTKNYWAYALSNNLLGFDMEEGSRRVSDKIVKALHPKEQEYLSGLTKDSLEWRKEFLAIWTAKESYMKYCKEGLRLGLSRFSVIDSDLSFAKIVQCKKYPAAYLYRIDGPKGLSAAICTEEEMDGIFQWSELDYDAPFTISIMEKAAGLLDTHDYTEKELATKLVALGYPRDDAAKTAKEIRDRGYINHEAIAERWIEEGRKKGLGKNKIFQNLSLRGIEKDIIREKLENIDIDETALAWDLAKKVLCGKELDEKLKAKVARRLSSNGFSPSIIYSIIDKLDN